MECAGLLDGNLHAGPRASMLSPSRGFRAGTTSDPFRSSTGPTDSSFLTVRFWAPNTAASQTRTRAQ